jgi:predicted site-specific integrase-resolvase
MKLSDWARKNGLTYVTAYNLFKNGNLPGKITQLKTGTILVDDLENTNSLLKTYIYCRVSSPTKKEDLLRQTERCQAFCAAKGLVVEQTIKEIASGVNDKRSKLLSLFDKIPKRIVVEHKDRLTRFGFNYFEKLLPLLGYELIVINRDFEEEKDLIKDMIAIVTSFCCRLYGLKRGKSKSKKIKEIIGDASDD